MGYIFFLYADILRLENEKVASARVPGAAQATRDALGLRFDRADQREADTITAAIQKLLPSDEFTAATESGSRMSIAEPLDYFRQIFAFRQLPEQP